MLTSPCICGRPEAELLTAGLIIRLFTMPIGCYRRLFMEFRGGLHGTRFEVQGGLMVGDCVGVLV